MVKVGPGIEPVYHDLLVPGPRHHVDGVVPGGGDGRVQVDLDRPPVHLEELHRVRLDPLPVVSPPLRPLPSVHQHPLDPPLLASLLVPYPQLSRSSQLVTEATYQDDPP